MPAHPDLPRSAGVPAQLANERYVEALARIVYYWGYPAVETFGRTTTMYAGAPVSTTSYFADSQSTSHRWVASPNNDTFSGAGFANLIEEPAVIQTPTTVPDGHYWTIQIVDVFTNVVHRLGSASATPGGKFLLAGPGWNGRTPAGFHDVLRMPTNMASVFPRSFAARTPEAKALARAVLNQIGMYPFSANELGPRSFDAVPIARKAPFPADLASEMATIDPDTSRPQWVNPRTFWDDLQQVLAANPSVGPSDRAMAGQARTLIALRTSAPAYRALLDRIALAAHTDLHASSSYTQVGIDAGNGWQRQEDAGVWDDDWFSRAQATVIYVYVNDYREATHFVRGTDAKGTPLDGRNAYTMRFTRDTLPPVDRSRGGFWSLTMYDKDCQMLPRSPNGRTNLGTVNLDAGELKFAPDGSLTLHLSAYPPGAPMAKANWLPAPNGPFSLILRAYVPGQQILEGSYTFPDVMRG
jgi:hypothetical protein